MSFFEMFTLWAGGLTFNRQLILAAVLWLLAFGALMAIRYGLAYGWLWVCSVAHGVSLQEYLSDEEDPAEYDWARR